MQQSYIFPVSEVPEKKDPAEPMFVLFKHRQHVVPSILAH
jgi:hypothetical protein